MYSTCLFCSAKLGANDVIEQCPVGTRLAFDSKKGRLWVVCRRCERWNLVALDERWEPIEDCERRFRGTRLRVSTDNIGLARLPSGLELVRIGPALFPEIAAWRYGDQFGRRRVRGLALLGGGVAAVGTLLAGGMNTGMAAGAGAAAVLNAAAALRIHMRRHHLVCRVKTESGDEALVREEHLFEARVLLGGPWGNKWGLAVTHSAGESVLNDGDAVRVAGYLLARLNHFGASPEDVYQSVCILGRHGNAQSLFRWAAAQPEFERHRLGRLPIEYRLALEMAAHEDTERAALEGELATLQRAWRDAEEIAAIADDLLLPDFVSDWMGKRNDA
jgi:hypothetical protein